MSRLFIIGAGFSKALANAPLANGFLKAIYEKTLNEDDKYKNVGNWHNDRAKFLELLTYLHESVIPLIDWLEKDDDKKILNRDFENFLDSLNIEFVCSFLDLHINHYFIPKAKGVDLQGCPIPYIHGFHKFDLESALNFILHHMIDLLLEENLSINTSAFKKMTNFFREDDKVISFNYDLLVEQMLWKRKFWNPFEGYGFEFERNGNEDIHESKVTIIKIHGSINWRSPDIFFHPSLELAIDHPFEDKPLFEGLKISKSIQDKEKYRTYPLYSHVILPTFMKSPQYNWEMDLINNALKLCRDAEKVYILGYSIPDADYITNLLLAAMNKDAQLRIVLWDKNHDVAKDLRDKIVEKHGFKKQNIKHENTPIERWIENGFKYLAYEKYLEDQSIFEEILNTSRNIDE